MLREKFFDLLCWLDLHSWEEIEEFEKPGPDPRNPIGHEECAHCGEDRYVGKFGGDFRKVLETTGGGS